MADIELSNCLIIEVHTGSYRAVRGYTVVAALCDESAFWRSDESANPDKKILAALRPAMATIPNGLLIGLSYPYRRAGALYEAYRDHYGKDGDAVPVWQADIRTRSRNRGRETTTTPPAQLLSPLRAAMPVTYPPTGPVYVPTTVPARLQDHLVTDQQERATVTYRESLRIHPLAVAPSPTTHCRMHIYVHRDGITVATKHDILPSITIVDAHRIVLRYTNKQIASFELHLPRDKDWLLFAALVSSEGD